MSRFYLMNKNMDKCIFFVSHMTSLQKKATSTDLLTNAIIKGIKQNGIRIVFFIICPNPGSENSIVDEYKSVVDRVILLPCQYFEGLSSGKQFILSLRNIMMRGFYRKAINDVIKDIDYFPELILIHAPCIESYFYGRELIRHFRKVLFYEFWSDPLAASGVLPDEISMKRYPIKCIEKSILMHCNRIIYGTKTLMETQKKLYPSCSSRMAYVDLGYLEDKDLSNELVPDYRKLIYAGNYYKEYRNIDPLVNAVCSLEGFHMDVYGDGDAPVKANEKVSFIGRISPEELNEKKNNYGTQICIMNHNCAQIPGKIFYDLLCNYNILIILDGAYSDNIRNYLDSYHRFVFCKNDVEEIRKALSMMSTFTFDRDRIRRLYSPKQLALSIVQGGIED